MRYSTYVCCSLGLSELLCVPSVTWLNGSKSDIEIYAVT